MSFQIKEVGKFKYVEEGEGEVIFLLHGLFGALSNFTELISFFSEKYKVVIPILPIYEMPLDETGVGHLANYVREFIQLKGYKNVSLVGNSLGGHIGLVYTLRHPQDVKTLTLTGSSGLFESAMGDTFPKRGNYEYIKTKTEDTFYDPKTATKELVDEVFDIVNDRNKAIRVVLMAKSAIRQNMAEHIPEIKVPCLLIWGKNDNVTPPFVAEDFHKLLPNSELNFIDKCGHAAMMERPTEFNEILGKFLEKEV